MIVGKHTSTGRGGGIYTGASSLNLLARARGAGERRVGQVLSERPLLADIVDRVELHAADVHRIDGNVRRGEQIHRLADHPHKVSLLMKGTGVESLRRSESSQGKSAGKPEDLLSSGHSRHIARQFLERMNGKVGAHVILTQL